MLFTMSMIVILHKVLLILFMVIHPMLLPLIDEFIPKVTTVSRLLLLSPICLACTTAKTVTIFKNGIPCVWQAMHLIWSDLNLMGLTKYSLKLIWSNLNLMRLTKFILKSFNRKRRNLHLVMLSCFHALVLPCFSWQNLHQ